MGKVACVAAGLLVLALAAVGAVSVTWAPAAQAAPPKPAAAAPKAAPAGQWITFLSHRTGYNLLYRMRPDGSDVRPVFGRPLKDVPGLTPGVTLYREPHWTRQSPDGKWFLSWAWDRGRPDEKYNGSPHFLVRVGSLDGGPTRVAAPDADEEFAWAPDSQRFAFAVHSRPPAAARDAGGRVRGTEIRVAGIDGSGEMTVLEKPGAWPAS
jgi:hypothetical protein